MGAKPGHSVSPETRAKISATLTRRNPVVICELCGRWFRARADSRGRFCSRQCSGRFRTGPRSANYKGGLSQMADGRWTIKCRDGTRVYFYRAVMAAHLGRMLDPSELVHHIDGDPTNDDLANLEVMSRADHVRLHQATGEMTNIADWTG